MMETTVIVHPAQSILTVILPPVDDDGELIGIFDETFDQTFE